MYQLFNFNKMYCLKIFFVIFLCFVLKKKTISGQWKWKMCPNKLKMCSKLSIHHMSDFLFWFMCCTKVTFFSFLLLFFCGIRLKGREANRLVFVLDGTSRREFSPHTTKHCKMFCIVVNLGWHSQTQWLRFPSVWH